MTIAKGENNSIPKDLKRITWLAKEYGFTYDEIYKAAKIHHEMPIYSSGALKVSLNDFFKWVNKGLEPARIQ